MTGRILVAVLLLLQAEILFSVTSLSVRPGGYFVSDGFGRSIEFDLTGGMNALLPSLPEDLKAGLTGGLQDSFTSAYNQLNVSQLKLGLITGYTFYLWNGGLRLFPALHLSGGYLDMGNRLMTTNCWAFIPQFTLTADFELMSGLRAGVFGGYEISLNEFYSWKGFSAGAVVTLELKGTTTGSNQTAMAEELRKEMQNSAGESVVSSSSDELKLRLGEILFEINSDRLKPEMEKSIANLAALAKKYPNLIIGVEGYTDDSGSAIYNLNLSEKRAARVAAVFASAGISGSRISSRGFGNLSPLVPNTSDENRAKNRRVDIRFTWK